MAVNNLEKRPTENIGEYKTKEDSIIKIPNWIKSKNIDTILKGEYELIKPVTAEFVTSLNCNFSCRQCAYKEAKTRNGLWNKFDKSDGSQMSEETMKLSIDRLVEGGIKNILITGGGEPLMNPVSIKAIKYAKSNGRTVGLYTNGKLLTPKTMEEILLANILFMRLSVYGGNEETVKAYTQKDCNSFTKVIGNIDKLTNLKKEIDSRMNLGLSYLIHPITMSSVVDFAKTIRDLANVEQINYIRFTPAVEYFGPNQHNPEMMKSVFEKINETIIPMFNDITTEIKPYMHRVTDLHQNKNYKTCRANGWFVEVAPNGKLYLCCEKHFLKDYEIGDLKTQSIKEIWDSKKRYDLIKKVNDCNLIDCPTLCKPHELNKVFEKIERLRNNNQIPVVNQWIDDIKKYGSNSQSYCAGKLDDFQS